MRQEAILKAYEVFHYPSAEKLYEILKQKYKLNEIKEVLRRQNVYQLYYNKPSILGGHILALAPLQLMQIDITFMEKFGNTNSGYKYILLCIDVFSRYAWGMPLKTKAISEITHAFNYVPKPQSVISDNGNEFLGKEFQALLKSKDINHQTAVLGNHSALGIVDRMTLTLKTMLYKNFIAHKNTKWFANLQDVFDAYNNTPNRGIYGYTPDEAMHDEKVRAVLTTINAELIKKAVNKNGVEEGDIVRVRKSNWTFKRGYTPKWSEDVAKVEKIVGNTIYIDGKRHKIVDVQVVNGGDSRNENDLGEALQKAVKEHKVKTVLKKEGVSEKNIIETRSRQKIAAGQSLIKWDASLIGRRVKKGKREGVIAGYDDVGKYKWFCQFDNGDSEFMSRSELLQYLI